MRAGEKRGEGVGDGKENGRVGDGKNWETGTRGERLEDDKEMGRVKDGKEREECGKRERDGRVWEA